MRWNPGHRSVNVEDRRGAGGGFMRGAGGMGAGGLVILVILSLIFGRDFVSLASDPGVAQPGAESGEVPPASSQTAAAKRAFARWYIRKSVDRKTG